MKETLEEKRKRMLALAKESVTQAYSTGEHAVIQAINTYNELEKAKNLIHERLFEWYGIYFPELRVSQHAYAALVSAIGAGKKQADFASIAKIAGMDQGVVERLAKESIGKDPEEKEYAVIKQLAETELRIEELQSSIDSYMKQAIESIMPNTTHILEYRIAAELLSKAGSLRKLANMPASTIQLLGAEKALFRHMKYGAKPPKYGVLFKLKDVTNAARGDKGKVARLYATKISIAARADAFSKRFIGDELKQSLDSSLERIKKNTKPYRPRPAKDFRQR
ncbi:MAG: C/D box methylation guide ribonucleoprotein complex aNOP56 subunit, partial [Candidatus Micrarchaeia archaeon]